MKKVAGPKAPKKQPEPEKPVSKSGILFTMWEYERNKAYDAINRFRDGIGPVGDLESGSPRMNGSIAEAIEWKGEAAMVAEDFLRGEARWAERFIEPLAQVSALPDDVSLLADIKAVLEEQEERIRNELIGNPSAGTTGGSGPWAHRSTNALANFRYQTACTAKRQAYALIIRMLRIINGE